MNGKEKKEFYLEYIYSLRMDVYRIIKSVIGDANVTEELTQIVLEKAWRSIESVRDKDGGLSGTGSIIYSIGTRGTEPGAGGCELSCGTG